MDRNSILRYVFYLCFIGLALFVAISQSDKVPTATDIEDYKDEELEAIFGVSTTPSNTLPTAAGPYKPDAAGTNSAPVPNPNSAPYPPPNYSVPSQPSQVPYPGGYSGASGQPQPSSIGGQVPYPPRNEVQPNFSNGQTYSGSGGLNELAAQGAQSFYAGVQQASRIFGGNNGQQQYEVPLFNSGAGLFGKRRK
ncbi:hypothetical protein Ddc_09785 [Ditylenchus destructor]|nr:hypothetical protein Ddc_09785 [Ditylenchus destructor]